MKKLRGCLLEQVQTTKPKKKGKLIIFIGLPGSGKTTEARRRFKENGRLMRVNRDDIRAMLFERWKSEKEKVVTTIEKVAISSALSSGYDVICDDTNLNPETREQWKRLALNLRVALAEESFDTPIATCVDRDANRDPKRRVGRPVIENMALKYGILPKVDPLCKVVIFDIDGTLADQTIRGLSIKTKPKNYDEYYSYPAIMGDQPIQTIIDWANACYNSGYIVLLVSGRPADKAGTATTHWLNQYCVFYNHIFMRNGGDFRDDNIIKQEILDKILQWIPKEQILFAVDDRKRIVEMWRRNGITCYPVPQDGTGDF